MEEKKLKVAVIGVGGISEVHIHGYKQLKNVELYAFCDINENTLKLKGERHGVTRLYTDEATMLRELPEIDAVSVCTWNAAHAPCTIMALNAGKHVLCEKPMAMNAQEAEEMLEAARRNNRLLMIGFVRRFGNDCAVLKDFIDAGDFGELFEINNKASKTYYHPWFTTAAGMYVQAVNELFVRCEGDEIIIAEGLRSDDFAFRGAVKGGMVVEVKVEGDLVTLKVEGNQNCRLASVKVRLPERLGGTVIVDVI